MLVPSERGKCTSVFSAGRSITELPREDERKMQNILGTHLEFKYLRLKYKLTLLSPHV